MKQKKHEMLRINSNFLAILFIFFSSWNFQEVKKKLILSSFSNNILYYQLEGRVHCYQIFFVGKCDLCMRQQMNNTLWIQWVYYSSSLHGVLLDKNLYPNYFSGIWEKTSAYSVKTLYGLSAGTIQKNVILVLIWNIYRLSAYRYLWF